MSERSDRARIDDLESRVAFQDDLIESLNEVVARQDREIAMLVKRVADLSDRVEQIASDAPVASGDGHEHPPHY